MSMNDRVINATPGPNTTRENLVVVRQIEAIRVALRLFDRQLEATAKEALDSTSRTVSLDVPRKRFLEELTSIRKGHRYEKIRQEAMRFKPRNERESLAKGATTGDSTSRSMTDKHLKKAPIVSDDGAVVGIISRSDINRYLVSTFVPVAG
ncbi:hypothetical protein CGOTT_10920 [Corynebacterium gottingense]|uniref:CBS domain-containing protein n=1 Tax=Corynebacterium gottingense TaxID=2041036 RepID=A0ABX9UH30_9CORY|nr:CBS domain-containing protein [Corynebacterium gottingense]WJZ14080.1 hypothetical protein CGOTT_10920 [Corynebacterium gottingense]